jgi:hypothetical protein
VGARCGKRLHTEDTPHDEPDGSDTGNGESYHFPRTKPVGRLHGSDRDRDGADDDSFASVFLPFLEHEASGERGEPSSREDEDVVARVDQQGAPLERLGEGVSVDAHVDGSHIFPGPVLRVEDDGRLGVLDFAEALGAVVADDGRAGRVDAQLKGGPRVSELTVEAGRLPIGVRSRALELRQSGARAGGERERDTRKGDNDEASNHRHSVLNTRTPRVSKYQGGVQLDGAAGLTTGSA